MTTEEYKGWCVEASSRLGDNGLVASAAAKLPRRSDENRGARHYVFNDLGAYPRREEAEQRAMMWAKKWIDDNFAS